MHVNKSNEGQITLSENVTNREKLRFNVDAIICFNIRRNFSFVFNMFAILIISGELFSNTRKVTAINRTQIEHTVVSV